MSAHLGTAPAANLGFVAPPNLDEAEHPPVAASCLLGPLALTPHPITRRVTDPPTQETNHE